MTRTRTASAEEGQRRTPGTQWSRRRGSHPREQLTHPTTTRAPTNLERVAGIEPAYSAWKAAALPLSYTREYLERKTGFEPATSTLARWRSTSELLPHYYGTSGENRTPDTSFWRAVFYH